MRNVLCMALSTLVMMEYLAMKPDVRCGKLRGLIREEKLREHAAIGGSGPQVDDPQICSRARSSFRGVHETRAPSKIHSHGLEW